MSEVVLFQTSNSKNSFWSNKEASNPMLLDVVASHFALGLPYCEGSNPNVGLELLPSIG